MFKSKCDEPQSKSRIVFSAGRWIKSSDLFVDRLEYHGNVQLLHEKFKIGATADDELLCGGKKLKHGFLILGSFGEIGVK